ncbi:MAG: DNA cytosine methyltransferase, partial [Bryobacterales bacterium]|nr:DNA cytosine methyltransferase [Bryobacterales bacterium]
MVSIEKDPVAYRTLLLRAFLRKFGTNIPPQYYEFLNGYTDREPDWSTLYPQEWGEACDETKCLELGQSAADQLLRKRANLLHEKHDGRTVLLGGPPCQSYSLVGRSRNAGNTSYDPERDERQSLYQEFVNVLEYLQPAIAIMENVKGMLSARHGDQPIFPKVMSKLKDSSRSEGYRLFALASESGAQSWDEGAEPKDFLVHADKHGVPQARHRVFIICIRHDIAKLLPEDRIPRLLPRAETVTVNDIIGMMPRLRSRLSCGDSAVTWKS